MPQQTMSKAPQKAPQQPAAQAKQLAKPGPQTSVGILRGQPGAAAGGGAAKKNGCEAAPELPLPVVLEQLAHKYAYKNEGDFNQKDHEWLSANGYELLQVQTGPGDFAAVSFGATANGKAWGLPPVLAFRGTDKPIGADGATDVDPAGVGVHQFCLNDGIIGEALLGLRGSGRPEVTGHSLGGALAQLAAVAYPGLVGHVTTFQSPGIGKENAQSLRDRNQRSGRTIGSDHHRVASDAVSKAGEEFTGGNIHTYKAQQDIPQLPKAGGMGGVMSLPGPTKSNAGPLDSHQTYPVARTYAKDNPQAAQGLAMGAEAQVSSPQVTSGERPKGSGAIEGLRSAAGTIAPGAISRLIFDKVWMMSRNQLVGGAPVTGIVVQIAQNRMLSKEEKQTMATNLGKLHDTMARAKKAGYTD